METSIGTTNSIEYKFTYDSEYEPIYDTPYDVAFIFGNDDGGEEGSEEDDYYSPFIILPNSSFQSAMKIRNTSNHHR